MNFHTGIVPLSSRIYEAMQQMDIERLSQCTEDELRVALPYLVRMSLCAPIDHSEKWKNTRKSILQILSDIEAVNGILALLSIDFHALQEDTRKEQQLRNKIGSSQTDSVLISQLEHGLTREFEQSDADRKLRLVLSDIMFTISKIKECGSEFNHKACELFEDPVYVEEVSDVLCIAHAELPSLLPVSDLAEALIRVKHGGWVLCKVLVNRPEAYMQVCQHLIKQSENEDANSDIYKIRINILLQICQLNPNEDLSIREFCICQRLLPELVIHISLNACKQSENRSNLIQFLTGLLLSNDLSIRSWFSQFIKTCIKKKEASLAVERMREEVLQEMIEVTPDEDSFLTTARAVRASSLIRLYCGLKITTAFKFSDTEKQLLLKLLTCDTSDSLATWRFIQLSVCTPLACPELVQAPGQERMVSLWIRRLVDRPASTSSGLPDTRSYNDLLFLLAIHFHASQRDAISDLVSNTLGMKCMVKANAITKIRDIFTKEIFTEQVITTQAASLPVTPNLNADISGYLSIHTVYQLLRTRTFTKYKVPIKDWIYLQLCSISPPLHPVLPSLIEAFVQSIILPAARTELTNQPMTEEQILSVFSDSLLKTLRGEEVPMDVDDKPSSNILSQLLMIYYVLLYEDVRCSNTRTIVTFNRQVLEYSSDLLSQLPISHVILATQKDGILPAELFASLLRLLTTHYPHLCLVQDWLDNTLIVTDPDALFTCTKYQSTVEQFKKAVNELNSDNVSMPVYSSLNGHLKALFEKPATDIIPYTDSILTTLPYLLESGVPWVTVNTVKRVWFRLHTVIPRYLRLRTLQVLRPKFSAPSLPITDKDVTVDPLFILRCDPRVFRCPSLLEIMLRILSAYLQASRVYLASHIQKNPITDKVGGTMDLEREELKNALVTAQESAAVQILLESCLPQSDDEQRSMLTDLQEVRCLICCHLHQMFIADPNLAKLVHFQGYDSQLLRVTVVGIPSMHICLDFLPELISQPQIEKQIFAIQLVTQLSLRYALPKTMTVAKLCIDVMYTVLQVFESADRSMFFINTLPCLANICRAFPPLCDDTTLLLTRVGRICLSHLSAAGVKHPNMLQESSSHSTAQSTLRDASPNITSEPYYRLYETVQKTFKTISEHTVFCKSL